MKLDNRSFERWCEYFDHLSKLTLLDKEDSEFLSKIIKIKEFDTDKEFENKLNNYPIIQAIKGRLTLFDYQVTIRGLLFLSLVSEIPGNMVMYLTYLQWKCFCDKIKLVDLDYLINNVFPSGFVSKSDLNTAWIKQKCDDGSNLLDKYQYMKSIRLTF